MSVTLADLRQIALALPETDEHPHFEITSFRVKKKVFATVNPPEGRATVRLSAEDQDVFCAMSKGAMYPVPNQWGKYGWTHIDLTKAETEMCLDALQTAWYTVAPPKLRDGVAWPESE